jgi:hypothetical protein
MCRFEDSTFSEKVRSGNNYFSMEMKVPDKVDGSSEV